MLVNNNYARFLEKYVAKVKKEDRGRYLSWEHCYGEFYSAHKEFQKGNLSSEKLDYLSLHLAFYLASWGMYRGSTFLLQRDYRIHMGVIKILFEEKYNSLWAININDYTDSNIYLMLNLKNSIGKFYNEVRKDVKEIDIKNEVSVTLITKILMGTLGCVPAYDRYFISGLRKSKVAVGDINNKSIKSLILFYKDDYEYLENMRKEMSYSNVDYPQMKIIDMIFWQIGFDSEQ